MSGAWKLNKTVLSCAFADRICEMFPVIAIIMPQKPVSWKIAHRIDEESRQGEEGTRNKFEKEPRGVSRKFWNKAYPNQLIYRDRLGQTGG